MLQQAVISLGVEGRLQEVTAIFQAIQTIGRHPVQPGYAGKTIAGPDSF